MSKPNQTDFELWQSKKRRYPNKRNEYLDIILNATTKCISIEKNNSWVFEMPLQQVQLMEDTESLLKQLIKQRQTCNKNSET